MHIEKQNIGEVYADLAAAESEPPVSTITIPKIREARDLVYSGTPAVPAGDVPLHAGETVPRNRTHTKRKISPFNIILLLIGGAVAIVLYIGNILAVGRLMNQVNQLQVRHQQILNEQELLRAHINKLSSVERIQQIARDQLGLQNSKQLPVWIEFDPDREAYVREVLQQQMEQNR